MCLYSIQRSWLQHFTWHIAILATPPCTRKPDCTSCITGVDKRFPKGTIYPGVIALYRALTEARHYRRMHRIQSRSAFGALNGHSAAAEASSVVSAEDVAQVDQVPRLEL